MTTRSLRPLATALALAAAAPSLATAQGGQLAADCASQDFYFRDACQKAVDIFHLLAPQLGTSLAGGNAVLGQSGTLGGLGRFTVGLRANALRGAVPRATGVSLNTSAPQRTSFQTEEQIVGLPTAEAAIGVFRGLSLGMTNVGGIDVIVSASYVPDLDVDEVSVFTSGGALKVGYGARLGILEETSLVPGVSFTYLRRDLPRTSVIVRTGSDTVAVNDIDAQTSAWRFVAGKRFLVFGLTAGVGQDTYESSANAGAVINRTIAGLGSARVETGRAASASQSLTRTNLFGDFTVFFPFGRLVAEVGRASGGEVPAPYNSFDGKTGSEAYTYGAVGLRVQF